MVFLPCHPYIYGTRTLRVNETQKKNFFGDILCKTVESLLIMPSLRTVEHKQHFQKFLLTLKLRTVFEK